MLAEERPIEIIRDRPIPLRIREGDIPEQQLGYVLARCWYCHEEYIPVKIGEYSPYVVYNCGCHKESIFQLTDWFCTVLVFGMVGILLGIYVIVYVAARLING